MTRICCSDPFPCAVVEALCFAAALMGQRRERQLLDLKGTWRRRLAGREEAQTGKQRIVLTYRTGQGGARPVWVLFMSESYFIWTTEMKGLHRVIILQLSHLPTFGKGMKRNIKEPKRWTLRVLGLRPSLPLGDPGLECACHHGVS